MENNRVFLGAAGIGGWEEYTLPLIKSAIFHSPELRIRVLDNASDIPYPRAYWVVREDDRLGYAAALNRLIELAGNVEWMLLTNNDVKVTKPITDTILALDPETLYGFHLVTDKGIPAFASGWAMLLHRDLYREVGPFDENFWPMYFEDADYTYRVKDEGFQVAIIDRGTFGLLHDVARHSERVAISKEWKVYHDANLLYLKDKHKL